jgi:hypothetical protein
MPDYAFYTRSMDMVQQLQETMEAVLKEYEDVCKFFGEDPGTTLPEDFFGIIAKFSVTYSVITCIDEQTS